MNIAYKFANMKFHDFRGPGPKCHDFPGLESKLSNSMTFQVFQDRYEPCGRNREKNYLSFFLIIFKTNLNKYTIGVLKKNKKLPINLCEMSFPEQNDLHVQKYNDIVYTSALYYIYGHI